MKRNFQYFYYLFSLSILLVTSAHSGEAAIKEFSTLVKVNPEKTLDYLEDSLYLNPTDAVSLVKIAAKLSQAESTALSRVLEIAAHIYPAKSGIFIQELTGFLPERSAEITSFFNNYRKDQANWGNSNTITSPLEKFAGALEKQLEKERIEIKSPKQVEATQNELVKPQPSLTMKWRFSSKRSLVDPNVIVKTKSPEEFRWRFSSKRSSVDQVVINTSFTSSAGH